MSVNRIASVPKQALRIVCGGILAFMILSAFVVYTLILLPYLVVKGFYLWIYGDDSIKQMAAMAKKDGYSPLFSILIFDIMEDAVADLEARADELADETERGCLERTLEHVGRSQEVMPLSHPEGDQETLNYYTFMDDFMFFIEDSYQKHPEKFEVPESSIQRRDED